MLIQRIEIQNYRALRKIDLDCETTQSTDGCALIALLGRNGTGKSSILYALDVFYDVAAKITTEDFYNHDPENEIMIRVTYGYLNETEKDEFKSFIENDQLIVAKRITSSDGRITQKYYGAARQIPEFAACRNAANKTELREKYAELAAMQKFSGIPAKSKSAVEALANMATFEADHPEMLETVEREQQFFGPKEVGGGKLDNYTKFVLVPAVRDASVDAAKKGVIYELIDMIVLRQINRRDDVRRLRAEMEERILEVFSPSNLTELRDLGVSISALLEQYAPGSALRLEWGEPMPPQIPLPPHKAALVEDDFASPVSHTGHGLQRALILTLLQHLAMTPRPSEEEEAPEQADGEAPTEVKSGIHDPDLILAIEEPELYLHPSRCRYLSELLLDLSKPPTDTNSPKNQIIYATHSAYFVDLHRFDQLRIARKPKDDDYPAPHCVISKYSLDQAAKELAKIADRKPEDFTRDSFRARALPVMTIAVNEGFFADTVIVVEGLSDLGVLWRVQEQLNQNWAALGIVVVPALGKDNLDRPVVVFRGLQIPTYFIFDGDSRHKDDRDKQKAEATIKRNKRYQRMAGVEPVDFPETQVHERWAVCSNDIETIIKESVGDRFEEIAQKACEELRYDGPSQLMKNTEGAARLVELIYEAGLKLDKIEAMVTRITTLRKSNADLSNPTAHIEVKDAIAVGAR